MSGGTISLIMGSVMVVLTLCSLVLLGVTVWMTFEWSWFYLIAVLVVLMLTIGVALCAGIMLADWKETR